MRNACRRCAGSLVATLLVACQHVAPAPLSPERSARALEARSLADPDLQRFLEAETGTRLATGPPARFDLALLTLTALYFQPSFDVARAQLEGAQRSRRALRGAASAGDRGARPGFRATPRCA